LPDENAAALSVYRLEKAREALNDADIALRNNSYNMAANRSYYSIFHGMRAVLALDGFDSRKHSGIISAFNKDYVKTGIFHVSASETIKSAFNVRGKSDYDDFFVVSKEEVSEQIRKARVFLDEVSGYLAAKTDTSADVNQKTE
jgi:uncharacterized protein (UPF0332 family)